MMDYYGYLDNDYGPLRNVRDTNYGDPPERPESTDRRSIIRDRRVTDLIVDIDRRIEAARRCTDETYVDIQDELRDERDARITAALERAEELRDESAINACKILMREYGLSPLELETVIRRWIMA